MQVRSFDSLTWLKAAAYGHVFLPFVRGYRITHRTTERVYWAESEFLLWKELTEHSCPFCESYAQLADNRLFRILHNISAFMETAERLHTWSTERIRHIIESTSPTYLSFLARMNDGLRVSRFA